VVSGVTPAADPAAALGELSCQSGGTPALPLMREQRDGNRPTSGAPPHPATCGPTNGPGMEGFKQKPRQCESSDYSHVQPVLEWFVGKLSECEFSTAKWLVYDYADIFSQSEFDLGHSDLLPHRIDTGSARPFKEQLRCHPMAHMEFIDS